MLRLLPWDYGVRNLGRSPLRLALSVGGSALVVLLVLAAGSFVRGMERSLSASGSPDNVILLGAGSEESVERSEVGAGVAGLVSAAIPGIRSAAGVPYVSPEVHIALVLHESPDSARALLALLRGVTDRAFLVHPQVQIGEGRAPEPGQDEIMVGRLAAAKMGIDPSRLAIGSALWFDGRPWTITGTFAAPGTVMEAEIWLPIADLQIATKRESVSCVIVTLDEAEFADVDAFCKQRLDLELVAIPEDAYYAMLTAFYGPVRAMAWGTALLIGLGGVFGGLNTMYAAFAGRIRELGTLQSLGFRRSAIVVSLVQESVLAAAAGSLIAAGVGVALLDGVAVRFSMGAFGLVLDAPVLALGLGAGVALGILGALPPAWRCLKMPITDALKSPS